MKYIIFIPLFVFILFPDAKAAELTLPRYELAISFDIMNNLLKGTAKITLPDGLEATVYTEGLSLTSVTMNQKSLPLTQKEIQAKGILEILYEVIIENSADKKDCANSDVVGSSVISRQGISLIGSWYPRLNGLAYYSLKTVLPEGFQAVSEAEEITVRRTPEGMEHTFLFPHPLDSLNLVAAEYNITKDTFENIDIYAYFFPEDISLAKSYMEHTKRYLKMYTDLLGPYPFQRFSVVENILPTGYSMPTFTLLGRTVVRLPFIVKTSLGHELLHQWFGNSVYTDYDKGNWSEGLTTYLADHLFDEQIGKGWEHRKKILLDFQNYVNPDNEVPLGKFIGRTDFASKAIGYAKGAMVFHMLKNQVGEDLFYRALRELIDEKRFRTASWDDVQEAFEKTSDLDLEGFFTQWVFEKGCPAIEIKDLRAYMPKGSPVVSFRAVQKGGPFSFRLPIKIITDKGQSAKILTIKEQSKLFEIPVQGKPLELVIDEGYDVMRRLSNAECPPAISGLLGDNNRLIVVPDNNTEKYAALIDLLKDRGFKSKLQKDIKDIDIINSSLLVFGFASKVHNRLFGKKYPLPGLEPDPGFTVTVRKNPLSFSKVVTTISGSSKREVDLYAKKIFHYGKYSHLEFHEGRNVIKAIAESDQGIRISLTRPVVGIRTEKTLGLKEIIQNIIDKPVIYVGEGHTLYEDHRIQLEVIRSLYESGRKVAIGMEMFQKPFQSSLDDYISGETTEKEFLKSSEYFKRWKYNYHLYREIVEFARLKNIPVVALNQEREIIKKVSREGLDSLTKEQRQKVPQDMDMSDEAYKKSLFETFLQHGKTKDRNFNNFYQAQILWDETMAHAVDDFLRTNPDFQMVIIAGAGHIAYGSGIPKRAHRLNRKDYVTILNAKAGRPITGLADFVLFPEPLSPPQSPKLGIVINKENKGVMIMGTLKGGPAEKAELKKGDRLLFIDSMEIGDIDDVHIALFDKKPGDAVKVKVSRKRSFLLSEKEKVFSIQLR